MSRRPGIWSRSAREGMTLVEVVVACTLLAITLTGLAGVALKMGQRTRTNAIIDQRTAVYFQEVNRLISLPYDSLTNSRFLQTDSVASGKGYYVWSYAIGNVVNSTTSGVLPYREVTLTVTPRLLPSAAMSGTIRRSRAPFTSALNTGT